MTKQEEEFKKTMAWQSAKAKPLPGSGDKIYCKICKAAITSKNRVSSKAPFTQICKVCETRMLLEALEYPHNTVTFPKKGVLFGSKNERSVIDADFAERGKALKTITELQTAPTSIESINYKVGAQGYPENVEAFEKEVERQHPVSHEDTTMLTRAEWQARKDSEARRFTDVRPEKWVLKALNELRVRWDIIGGDFTEVTKKWFIDHPADLVFICKNNVKRTEAKRWQGFKGGLKGGRPKKYHSPEERRKAKAESQRKRTAKNRRTK